MGATTATKTTATKTTATKATATTVTKRPPARAAAESARQTKTFVVPVDFKASEETPGAFRATFSLFNVKDLDNDVTLPGAFTVGAPVRLAAWGHNWGAPAIGTGTIGADGERAWIDGQFNLNMETGRETYESVKALGSQQQWSYGYQVDEWSEGEFEKERVTFLRKLTVHEVSPVMLGAQPLTSTDRIKGAKAGRRNAAADLAMMHEAAGHLQSAMDLMAQLMADGEAAADDAANDGSTDDAGGDGSGGGKLGGGTPPIARRSRETTAARIATELLELDT